MKKLFSVLSVHIGLVSAATATANAMLSNRLPLLLLTNGYPTPFHEVAIDVILAVARMPPPSVNTDSTQPIHEGKKIKFAYIVAVAAPQCVTLYKLTLHGIEGQTH